MENSNLLNAEFEQTNGNENLQNHSEENIQATGDETTAKSNGRRHYRKNNKTIANLNLTRDQKKQKEERLSKEIADKKADLDRGYLIVQLGEDSERVKHVQLDAPDKEIIRSVIAEKEYEKYELGLDIGDIELKICDLAAAKKSSYKDKLSKRKAGKMENDLVRRVNKELDKASQNGSKELVSKIEQQVKEGKTGAAYDSLKSFLSQEVKTVSKKLNKSSELEQKVLERVLDKLNTSES